MNTGASRDFEHFAVNIWSLLPGRRLKPQIFFVNTAYGHITLLTDYPKNDHIIRQIVDHLKENKIFALCADVNEGEDMAAMIYNPKNMKALHTNGDLFTYDTPENFTDSIRLTLIAYPKFMSGDKFLNDKTNLILLQW